MNPALERDIKLWRSSPSFRADNPEFWLRRNARVVVSGCDQQTVALVADLGYRKSQIIRGILSPLKAALKCGSTVEQVTPIVTEWAGPLAKWISVGTVKKGVLILTASNPAVSFELKRALPRLLEKLAPMKVTRVTLRQA